MVGEKLAGEQVAGDLAAVVGKLVVMVVVVVEVVEVVEVRE